MKKQSKFLAAVVVLFFSFAGQAGEWKKNQHGSIDYWAYIPSRAQSASPAVMFNLHGCDQSIDTLKNVGNWESIAEKKNMIVVIPQVPNGGVLMHCWDYYGENHDVEKTPHKEMLALTEKVIQEFRADSRKVFISGLSSGAGEAALLSCLRPDLFKGLGLSSSPALGSTSMDAQSPSGNPEEMKALCEKWAGNLSVYLKKQKVALITSDRDMIANPKNTFLNRDMYNLIFESYREISVDTKTLPGNRTDGQAFVYQTAQGQYPVSLIINNQLGHNWPAGAVVTPAQVEITNHYQESPISSFFFGNFVSNSSVDFPTYLGEFFLK